MKKLSNFLLISLTTALFLVGCDSATSSNITNTTNNDSTVENVSNETDPQTTQAPSNDSNQNNDSQATNNNQDKDDASDQTKKSIHKDTKKLTQNEVIEWIMVDLKQQYNDAKLPVSAFYFNFDKDEKKQLKIEVRENHEDSYFNADKNTSPLAGMYLINTNGELTKMNIIVGGEYEVIGTQYLEINEKDKSNE